MPKIAYIDKGFHHKKLEMIRLANEIIDDYMGQGFTLTLRQLYYRFVASDLISNTGKSYKQLGAAINEGRLAGLIDWDAIEDRDRNLNTRPCWSTPGSIIRAAANSYALDKWEGQEFRVEVWVEKQALESVIESACEPFGVPSFACKGYTSQSEMWRAAQRFADYRGDGQVPAIIHLGDHDPSGIDMTRDIQERLDMFGVSLEVDRIALNMDQIEAYNPPPNPAKLTDTRAQGYIARFGFESWELDALEPKTLQELIRKAILRFCDIDLFHEVEAREMEEKDGLLKVSAAWSDVVRFVDEEM